MPITKSHKWSFESHNNSSYKVRDKERSGVELYIYKEGTVNKLAPGEKFWIFPLVGGLWEELAGGPWATYQ